MPVVGSEIAAVRMFAAAGTLPAAAGVVVAALQLDTVAAVGSGAMGQARVGALWDLLEQFGRRNDDDAVEVAAAAAVAARVVAAAVTELADGHRRF